MGKVMWAGKATVFMMGLALMLALIFGMASTALGANNDPFILGVLNNTATAITKLTGNVSGGPALQVVNNKTEPGSRGLQVTVAANKPPIVVNASAGKAPNLNADKLDGKDSTGFVEARRENNGNFFDSKGIVAHSEGLIHYNPNSVFEEVVTHAPEGPPVDVLLSCSSETSNGTLRIVNKTTERGDLQEVWVDDGSANPTYEILSQNNSIDKSVVPGSDHFTIKVASIFSGNRMATIDLFTKHGTTGCSGMAHVIYTF